MFFVLMALFLLGSLAEAKVRVVVERDSNGNKSRMIELRDTVRNGVKVTDTLSVMTFHDSVSDAERDAYTVSIPTSSDWNLDAERSQLIIVLTGIVFVFGMPIVLLFIIFYFRHKNRKAKYRLAEQALAQGQPLPPGFLKEVKAEVSEQSTLNKGIRNIFLGIGLFIFLWLLTTEVALGSIGLLIMFTGFGQVVIYYANRSEVSKRSAEADKKPEEEPCTDLMK